VLHESEALWIYANRVAAPGPLRGRARDRSTVDMILAGGGSAPTAFLASRSMGPGAYMFDSATAALGDERFRTRTLFRAPTGIAFVEVGGVAPHEIVVTAGNGSGSSGAAAGLFVV